MSSSRAAWAAILLLGAYCGYRYWDARYIPPPTLEPGERAGGPALPAPERMKITREEASSSIMIAKERPDTDGRVGGLAPKVFERPAISTDSLALAKPKAAAGESGPWWRNLDPKFTVILIAGVFLAIYGVLTLALKKGPGGGGFTND